MYDQQLLAQKYDEALKINTVLCCRELFSYDGDRFTVNKAVLLMIPVQDSRIPVTTPDEYNLYSQHADFNRSAICEVGKYEDFCKPL